MMFLLLFLVMGGRLVDLTVFGGSSATRAQARSETSAGMGRGDIVDRNGVILATSLPTASVYADPHDIIDPDLAVAELAKVFPDLDREVVRARLASSARFVWVRRGLTPDQQDTVNRLGIPGLSFMTERRRVYPHGRAAAHVIGFTDIDDHGIAGVEQWFDPMLSKGETLRLSLDIRVQDILRHELQASQREFRARGRPVWCSTSPRERPSAWFPCRTSIPTSRRSIRRTTPGSTGSPRAFTRWARR
ncbi:MAG: hypothetical protein HWD60_14910 [Defluviicoccus sp.]|nr:MAG: hypothetical protein HWD60_14910 [Defluviicoccus sp.]